MSTSKITATNNRIAWVDLAKGLAILLVIIGHTVYYGNTGPWIQKMIYSFHMPLFFILSGFTFHLSTDIHFFKTKAKKLFHSMIIPAFFVYIIEIILEVLYYKIDITSFSFYVPRFYGLLFWTAEPYTYASINIHIFNRMWFLMTLFISKIIFDYLYLKIPSAQFPLAVVSLSFIGYAICLNTKLFLSIETALIVLPFLLIGHLLKSFDFTNNLFKRTIIYFIVWLSSFFIVFPISETSSKLNIAARSYPLFPFCFIPAIAGTLFVCNISIMLVRFKIIKPLVVLGKNSLYLLFAHVFDFPFREIWSSRHDQYVNAFLRIMIDIIIFTVIMSFRTIIRKMATNTNKNI